MIYLSLVLDTLIDPTADSPDHDAISHSFALHSEIYDPQFLPQRQHNSHHCQLRRQIHSEDDTTRNTRIRPECYDQWTTLRLAMPL